MGDETRQRPIEPARMMTSPSLLARVREGCDPGAWAEFESRYRELVYLFCVRRGLQHADAEDCAQAVLINLFRAMPKFQYDRERGRFRDYVYRCTRGVLSRWHARPKSGPARLDINMDELLATGAVATRDEHAEALWEQEWVAHHMRRALAVIRHEFEARSLAIFDACLSGRSTSDIASEFATTQDAVHKVRQRVRARLEAVIAQHVREEEGGHG